MYGREIAGRKKIGGRNAVLVVQRDVGLLLAENVHLGYLRSAYGVLAQNGENRRPDESSHGFFFRWVGPLLRQIHYLENGLPVPRAAGLKIR